MKPDKPSRINPNRPAADLQRQAEQKSPSLIAEFVYFILHNKKWWLIPIIVMLLLIGGLLLLSGTGLGPFMYTLI